MSIYVNAKMITWARERNGLTIEELAKKLKKKPEDVRKWESGQARISYASLEALAYKHLKIPMALFYFPAPPDLDDPKKAFRRLPEYELDRLSSNTLQIIRLGQAYQESLVELVPPTEGKKRIFKELRLSGRETKQIAFETRKYLGITLTKQFEFQSTEAAFKAWRHSLEEVGVFTFKDTLKDRFVSGFSLQHDRFPIIFVNNSNAHARQVFTLFHELAHILFGVSGITDVDETYVQFMSPPQRLMEMKCNEYAAEVLVPEDAFRGEVFRGQNASPETLIVRLAKKYSVSREVILRKFLNYDLVTPAYYEQKVAQWNKDYLRDVDKTSGGNYYLTRLAYLGEGFARIAFRNYHAGEVSKSELATHLNMNARNIDRMEDYLSR
jgi:Zn-dependent peptidase ImmA (M78 family)/transcriptional regulator with XRE-family HTH domain